MGMFKLNPYKQGEWDMFERISSVWYGKQYYFLDDDGTVYSRLTHKNMSREEAFAEFLKLLEW